MHIESINNPTAKQYIMADTNGAEAKHTENTSEILAPKKRSACQITASASDPKKLKTSDQGEDANIGLSAIPTKNAEIWSKLRYLEDGTIEIEDSEEDCSESEKDQEAYDDESPGSNFDDEQQTDFLLHTQSKTAWRVPMVLEKPLKKLVYFPKKANAQTECRVLVKGSVKKIVIFSNDLKSTKIEELYDWDDDGDKAQESAAQTINDKEDKQEDEMHNLTKETGAGETQTIADKEDSDAVSLLTIEEAPLEDEETLGIPSPSDAEPSPLVQAKLDSDTESVITIEDFAEDQSPTASPVALPEDSQIAMEVVDELPQAMEYSQMFNGALPYCPPALSIFEYSPTCNDVLAVIKEDIELYGTVVLTLFGGQITVNGFNAKKRQSLTIYSPKGISWVSICPKKRLKPIQEKIEWEKLSEKFTRAQLDNLRECFNSQEDALVLLQRNTKAQNMLDTLKRYMNQILFPHVNSTSVAHSQSERVLNCYIQSSDKRRTLQVPNEWTKLKINKSTRLMVIGGKGVGKSTLLRYLLNRHLNVFPRVLFIDLDIGQPEIFLQQTVSCTILDEPLLGPGILLNKQPDRAYVVGDTNIVMCHMQYAKAVTQLMSHIHQNPEYAEIPFLINTMGYNRGFGLELMALLVDCVQPTDVVQISSTLPINNFSSPLDWSNLSQVKGPYVYKDAPFRVERKSHKYALHVLPSAVPPREQGVWRMSPRDMRFTNLLVRLSSCLRGNAKHPTDCQPISTPFGNIHFVHPTEDDVEKSSIIAGMEANWVFLAHRGAQGLPVCLGMGKQQRLNHFISSFNCSLFSNRCCPCH
ncbi:blast:Polynucleotide 5'-hydroxyl-kinase NOL9 [Drosophila guanche]|uniref:Polynucleotide 5'-hydroxyl-kinase NOL9 n=1 Tax=Drosophila guanche TaxID=7266 RepID=A0A3B0J3Q4_DROGU|nr:blast:Polynucleotide 5'-hydroxyl-kinase NOL9 [Drosophila guanche]